MKITAAVIQKNKKVFIAKRKKDRSSGGKWEFPGGKVEFGETQEEALKRELKEEFGIDTEIKELMCSERFTCHGKPAELLVYRVEHKGGEFIPVDHEEIKWTEPSELKEYDFLEADKKVIDQILERL